MARLLLHPVSAGVIYFAALANACDAVLPFRYLGWDLENGQVTIGGEGNTPISFTSRADLSRFIVHVLTAVPAERLANGTFRVEGERTVSPLLPLLTHPVCSRRAPLFVDIE